MLSESELKLQPATVKRSECLSRDAAQQLSDLY